MNGSAPRQESGLSVPVDLTDDDPPNGAELSAPSAKKARLRLQQPSSSGRSATGRPPGKMLDLCTDSGFWSGLKTVLRHIGPLLIAVRAVQSEQTKLEQVFKLLGYLHQHFVQVDGDKVKRVMLKG
ncbi:TPA: hypothetical protein ACH3X1_015019 [Trebouxia sp. C0004]